VPWAVPSSAAGLIWGVIFRPLDGLANQIAFSWLHLSSFPIHWLSGDAARVTLLLPSIWRWAPFSTIIFLAALHFIPADQYEAASIDGANGWQKFRYITWPFLAPAMAALVLFGIIYYFFGLNGYNIGYLLFNNDYFGRSAELFIPMLVRQTFVSNLFGFGAAISVLLMAVSALVLGLGYWVYRTFSESL
jgi:ABC-type sugar transport system permease subunit